MSCEQLKDFVIYGGVALGLFCFAISIVVKRRFNVVLKEHKIGKEQLTGSLENLPLPAQEKAKLVKKSVLTCMVLVLVWAICLVSVLGQKC